MFGHPFIDPKSLKDKTLEELQEVVSGLYKKISYAQLTGNMPMLNQLQMVLTSYQSLVQKKTDEAYEKYNIQTNVNVIKRG